MNKKTDKLKFFNKRGKQIMSVSEDGNVIWHSKENNVNKLELIEAIHTTLENMPDLSSMMRNKVENDINQNKIENEIKNEINETISEEIQEIINDLTDKENKTV